MTLTLPHVAVLGYPIKHSRSPLIHNYWLELYEKRGQYTKVEVSSDDFSKTVHNLHQEGFVGFNVTLPHKFSAYDLADIATDIAQQTGAVNTLWWDDQNRLNGDNTDVYGFLTNLDRGYADWQGLGKKAVILGAGGAASAVFFALLSRKFQTIVVVNRDQAKARALVDKADGSAEFLVYDWSDVDQALDGADFLVNTSSLGMQGAPSLDLDLEPLPSHACVSDIVYTPLVTNLLARAEARGLAIVGGLGMLLHQAVPGFERWFGVRPEVTQALYDRIVASLNE